MSDQKIGTFYGVFVPNVTMMFGVILFLRMGVIVGHAGPLITVGVVALSLIFMLITSCSIAAIATNREVGAGGTYYLITRSLGIEMGGALGIATYVSQLLTIALTVSGFARSLQTFLPQLNVQWVELAALLGLAAITSSSAKFALKVQTLILLVLCIAIGSAFFGSVDNLPPLQSVEPMYANGVLGFWAAFALFYPAMTGIEASMALSGTFKNPARSLIVGNFSSLLFAAGVYISLPLVAYLHIPTQYLKADPFSMVSYAHLDWLVLVGVCVATLSSALAGLLGAPRILQSMAEDGAVHPILGKAYGPLDEPRWALGFTTVLAAVILYATTIDKIIPILTMICLINYTLLNVIAALASRMDFPSWNPQFKVPAWLPALGVVIGFVAMFMVNAGWSFAAIVMVLGLYLYFKRSELEVEFEDFRQSIVFSLSRVALYRLAEQTHALTWHPKILFLATSPASYAASCRIASHLTAKSGLLTFASAVPEDWNQAEKLDHSKQTLATYFDQRNIKCFIEVITAATPYEGFVSFIKSYGVGAIQPNTVMLPLDGATLKDANVVDIIECCKFTRKNLILMLETEDTDERLYQRRSSSVHKQIDVYWDSGNRESFDLISNLVTILKKTSKWMRAKVVLKALCEGEQAAVSMHDYLENYVQESPVSMSVEVIDTQKNQPQRQPGAHFSIVPFNPVADDEPIETYLSYLQQHVTRYAGAGLTFFVCCFDQTEHRESYVATEIVASG